MEVKFNKEGKDRKDLVKTISEITGVKSKYKGAPTFSYQIDYFTVDKEGTLIFDDRADSNEIKTLLEKLAEKGFVAETTEESKEHTNTTEEGSQSETVGLTVAMPATYFVDDALENLQHIIEAKGNLIKKALGLNSLPIFKDDDKVSFPWFSFMPEDSETVKAYTHFIYSICEMARNQKRISPREKEVDNEKYAFRCFLLRLGFIGDEYKKERKILLQNLTGSSAFKGGARNEVSE
ncbi:virulence protein [Clostridium sp. HMP27]|uniref:virulence protein n=1 Tax=Clostridium sp. HMP27 TaxID=1487921 RepID=UPI00052D3DE7|nr:virulence protein [Clostridium sp. HMP27]KGK87356.1 virulence protein [Clostridium sp. HMP27]